MGAGHLTIDESGLCTAAMRDMRFEEEQTFPLLQIVLTHTCHLRSGVIFATISCERSGKAKKKRTEGASCSLSRMNRRRS